ncbi:MAG: hypothetical protein ABJF04_22830 [Reichenbachiella sp.]|uniref:hypothetical protein n=1 Tax=Reichenbachiella sp. TaxID=2184521 RepID=UPI0032650743
MLKQYLLFVLVTLCTCSCSKRTSDPSALPEDKHTSELTYMDIYNLALAAENGGGMDFHGDAFGNDAEDDLSIYANGGCGKEECGISLVMENKNAERSISAVIKAKFKLPGNNINEMIRMYELLPGQALSIGCSHICHQDNSYMIQREIVSAGYVESKESDNQVKTDSTESISS